MKKLLIIILVCIGPTWYAFTPDLPSITLSVKQQSDLGLEQMMSELDMLSESVQKQNVNEALKTFKQLRGTFKKHEFILEYFHHEAIKKFINGAPLPQIEKKVADPRIRKPQGMQRLEEVLYEEEVDWKAAEWLVKLMREHLIPIARYHKNITLYDRHVLEAIRFELIRVFSLGVAGFDTPSSGNALTEAMVVLEAMRVPAESYAERAGMKNDVADYFEAGINQLEKGSFDTFDRYTFLTTCIDPLFEAVLEIHLALQYETYEETNTGLIPTNYTGVESMFDIDLLNTSYFLQSPFDRNGAKVSLGEKLFFDKRLSSNNLLSCGSCHDPKKAFTDGLPRSLSADGKSTVDRNSPTLVNAVFSHAYFHDLRTHTLSRQTEHVMINAKEFNTSPMDIERKLNGIDEYQDEFDKAYPSQKNPLRAHNVEDALAHYVASLTSWDSKFDRNILGVENTLTDSEINGFNIFMGKAACGTCHFAPTFAGLVPPFFDDTESEVLGVTLSDDSVNVRPDEDLGRYSNGIIHEDQEFYQFSFKTPTLRNIEVTAPYFHNGVYKDLESTMWFYNNGGGQGLGLEYLHQTLPSDHLHLGKREIADVIAFMKSLTNVEYVQ